MEKNYNFKLALSGTMDGYSEEHVKDKIINNLIYGVLDNMYRGCYAIQVEDKDVILKPNALEYFEKELYSFVYSTTKKAILNILHDLEKQVPEPPIIFDRTDYIKTRLKLIEILSNIERNKIREQIDEPINKNIKGLSENLFNIWTSQMFNNDFDELKELIPTEEDKKIFGFDGDEE